MAERRGPTVAARLLKHRAEPQPLGQTTTFSNGAWPGYSCLRAGALPGTLRTW